MGRDNDEGTSNGFKQTQVNLNTLLMVCMIGFMGWLTTTTLTGVRDLARLNAILESRIHTIDRMEIKIDELQTQVELLKNRISAAKTP